jgi:hypothetical protein
MWANDFRSGSSWSHFWDLRPSPIIVVSTSRLCHINSTGSGTSPSSFRLNRFRTYPWRSVISALGMRGVLDMAAPPVDVIDMKTPPALRV